ncbi:MAG: hypothetical protein WCI18_15955 [Pseudomonadota bacterium]
MMVRALFKTPSGFRDQIKKWTLELLPEVSLELVDHELGFTATLEESVLFYILDHGPWFEDVMAAVLWKANVPHREYVAKELKKSKLFFKDYRPKSLGLAVRIKHDSIHTVRRVREAFSQVFSDFVVHGQDQPSEIEALITIEKRKLTFWLSLSGTGTFKRGQREVSGFLAPMREDLAATLISMNLPKAPFHLWLPFAGSGTYFFEAKAIASGFHHPNFNQFVGVTSGLFQVPSRKEVSLHGSLQHAFIEDIHSESVAKILSDVKLLNLDQIADVQVADFFKTEDARFSDSDVYLPMNPPWGLRLGKSVNPEFFLKMGQKISKMKFRSLSGFVLCPDERASKAFLKGYLGKTTIQHFTQGGKHIRAVYF